MRWPVLAGKKRLQPTGGRWHDWKEAIANDCGAACIYCAVTEGRLGGLRGFHVEHFRPKSRFPKLENEIANLYLACGICNVLKSDDWPGDPKPDHSVATYPDPAHADFNVLLEIHSSTFVVESRFVGGRYLIGRVMLNRGQLVVQRRLSAALAAMHEFEEWLKASSDHLKQSELRAALSVLVALGGLKTSILGARPYLDAETKRPPKTRARKKRSKS